MGIKATTVLACVLLAACGGAMPASTPNTSGISRSEPCAPFPSSVGNVAAPPIATPQASGTGSPPATPPAFTQRPAPTPQDLAELAADRRPPTSVAGHSEDGSIIGWCESIEPSHNADGPPLPRVHCAFGEAGVEAPPTSDEIAKTIAEGQAWVTANGAQACAKLKSMPSLFPTDPNNLDIEMPGLDAVAQACSARDPIAALAAVFVQHARDVTARTCKMTVAQFSEDFERADDGSWVSHSLSCDGHRSRTVTLSRTKAADLWQFKSVEVNTGGVLPAGVCSRLRPSEVIVYSSAGYGPPAMRQLDCHYVLDVW